MKDLLQVQTSERRCALAEELRKVAEWRANKPTADAAPHGSMVRRHSSKWDDQLAAARATSGTPFRHTQASRAAAAVPLTSEEARQQVQVEGLTLRVSESKTGYFGVSLPIPGQPKPYQAVLRNLNRVSIQLRQREKPGPQSFSFPRRRVLHGACGGRFRIPVRPESHTYVRDHTARVLLLAPPPPAPAPRTATADVRTGGSWRSCVPPFARLRMHHSCHQSLGGLLE